MVMPRVTIKGFAELGPQGTGLDTCTAWMYKQCYQACHPLSPGHVAGTYSSAHTNLDVQEL